MKIQLTQTEIETAVREYVANQGIKVEGKEMSVDFKMTRGDDGLLADLEIADAKPEATKTVARRTSTVSAVPKENSVGDRIAKQSEPKATEAPATSAAEAIAAAEKAAAEAKAEPAGAVAEETEVGGEEVKETPKATTSLFG